MSSSLACEYDVGRARAPAQRRLDELPVSPTLEVRPALGEELPQLSNLLMELVPGIIAPFSSFRSVHSHSQSIYVVKNGCSLVGCFACLHLNAEGVRRLLDGSLSMVEPQSSCLAETGTRVEAIYAWAWAIRPPTNGIRAMGNLMSWLRRPEFEMAEIYGRPLTEKGLGFGHNLGSRLVESGLKGSGLWVSTRFS